MKTNLIALCAVLALNCCIFFACTKNLQTNSQTLHVPPDNITTVYSSTPAYSYQQIFSGGDGTYHSYRIPSFVKTTTGTLLALCEGRKNNTNDYGNIDIVFKRSTDNGATWSARGIVYDPGNYTVSDPTMVVDQTNNKIWVFMLRSDSTHYTRTDGTYLAFTAGDRTVWASYSTNDGVSWSSPVNLTSSTQPSTIAQDYIGPGTGIQIKHGANLNRLILPAYGRNIYSDNNGTSWTNTTYSSGTTKSTECTIMEKLNGDLYRNDRATTSETYNRQVSTGSISGGFTTWASDLNLPDPKCEGSVLRYNDPQPNRIMLMNSNSQSQRRHPYIHITYDEGGSWQNGREIPQNGTGILGGYTSLAKTADLTVGALIEYNESNTAGNMSIQFHKFNLSWILNGASEPTGY
jgi:sialidase-1